MSNQSGQAAIIARQVSKRIDTATHTGWTDAAEDKSLEHRIG